MVSVRWGIQAATRSPGPSPAARIQAAMEAVWARRSSQLSSMTEPSGLVRVAALARVGRVQVPSIRTPAVNTVAGPEPTKTNSGTVAPDESTIPVATSWVSTTTTLAADTLAEPSVRWAPPPWLRSQAEPSQVHPALEPR